MWKNNSQVEKMLIVDPQSLRYTRLYLILQHDKGSEDLQNLWVSQYKISP